MRIHTKAPPPLLIGLALAFFVGAAALAWFSALAALNLTRIDATTVQADFENRIFGLIPVSTGRVDGIRSVRLVSGRLPDSTSRSSAADFLTFETDAVSVDRGYTQQRFARSIMKIRDFINDTSQRQIVLSSAYDVWEKIRFGFAQFLVLCLTLFGALLVWLVVRGLFPDPYAGVGPR